jgi:hypothetical protein
VALGHPYSIINKSCIHADVPEDHGVDGRIMAGVWIRSIWLRIGTTGELL